MQLPDMSLLFQYIGLYDYNPLTSSPSPNPEFELGFKEGSLMKIFGREMSDGYFVGEVRITAVIHDKSKLNLLCVVEWSSWTCSS